MRWEWEKDEPTPLALVAPAISTAVTVNVGFVLGWLVFLTPAVCCSCGGERLDRFVSSLKFASIVCGFGLVVPVGLLVVSWVLPRRRRHNAFRVTSALLAPLALVGLFALFALLIEM
ncbi:hypothetical protein [Streptomyces albospinus]|uniref:hypothetical protein n=1 Tax=Streptomyces albospinus TaxID=285515 RepID=UPI001E621576|nr:hypothetical protein [Streptomyces albospinus]